MIYDIKNVNRKANMIFPIEIIQLDNTKFSYVELKNLSNFLYCRDNGFFTLMNKKDIGKHFGVAYALLSEELNCPIESLSSNYDIDFDNAIEEWLKRGNRAYKSECADYTVVTFKNNLNDDEKEMFTYDMEYKLDYLD